MINKKEFVKLMKEFLDLKKDEKALNDALEKFEPDFGAFGCCRYETIFIKALEFTMEDTTNNWISYWVYELDCGKDAKKDCVSIAGKSVPIKTLSDLWNLLVNMGKRREKIRKEK